MLANKQSDTGRRMSPKTQQHTTTLSHRPYKHHKSNRNQHSGTTTTTTRTTTIGTSNIKCNDGSSMWHLGKWHVQHGLVRLVAVLLLLLANSHGGILVKADADAEAEAMLLLQSTTPMQATPINHTTYNANDWLTNRTTTTPQRRTNKGGRGGGNVAGGGGGGGGMSDSIFMLFARRLSTGNELWDGIIRDCYQRPSFACFQKNVYSYLSDAFDVHDVNVTQRLKFYRNAINYTDSSHTDDNDDDDGQYDGNGTTEAGNRRKGTTMAAADAADPSGDESGEQHDMRNNAMPATGRAASEHTLLPESPIEEVTNALYGKSIKFAMTHDVELKLPEMLFDGATFRISPKQIEGNGIIAKLELIPKQEIEARLAGKIIMKKIQKFLRSKVLLSLVALVLIIKIIKIKFFWLLPLVIGVGAAKKLLLKFLLFLFPALSHLFKLCSYYQQTYHTTKYHHHHHLINHHHTIVPAWHNAEHDHHQHHHPGPELIYTQPPKGHVSAYLHGAPIHETYGPPSHEHFDNGGWENSGPGLGSEYINDINRIAQVDENSNNFVPHTNDVNTLHAWGLGTTQIPQQQALKHQQQQQQQQRLPTQQQKPPLLNHQYAQQQQQQQKHQKPLNYQKPHATSNNFNPFQISDKQQQSIFHTKQHKGGGGGGGPAGAHSAPHPVYTPQRSAPPQQQQQQHHQAPGQASHANPGSLTAAQIAAQYEPHRKQQQQQQLQQQQEQQKLQQQLQQLPPELSAQLKEAIRIQAEQRIIAQQQKILEHQPFVQDGQPIMPKNYDPFYSPILQKIDKILEQLGVADELCKERLVCSMYKDPTRYSPHSNFLSAELSRDTSELEQVSNSHPAVIRFQRLMQAARDGQDQKDCLQVYPNCNINTE